MSPDPMNLTDETKPVAWEIEINSMACIVFAPTLPKARWIAVRGYWDAGYGRPGSWPSCKAKRRPLYDKSILTTKKSQPWTEEYVQSMTP